MIDVENYVVDKIKSLMADAMPAVRVIGSHVRTPSEFPCVMIYESANNTFEGTRWIDGIERHAEIRFTVEVCTNDRTGKKEHAKKISEAIDNEMQRMGFFRASRSYTFGTAESSIFIVMSAYRGLVGEGSGDDENSMYVYRR